MAETMCLDEGPVEGPSLSPQVLAAVDALGDPCWQLRDAPTIASAILGERGVDPCGLLAMVPDHLHDAVADAMRTAGPDPEGMHLIVREADSARRRRETSRTDDVTLPPPCHISQWMADPPRVAPPLIEGILRCGGMMFLTAASKSGKSWIADDLAISVASGTPWLGMPCHRGRVLLTDFELDPGDLNRRLSEIVDHRSHLAGAPDYAALCSDHIDVWCLREHPVTTGALCDNIGEYVSQAAHEAYVSAFGYYSLIIIDPLYSLVAGDGADENSASEMGRTLTTLRATCSKLGAACAVTHHHPKGASGSRDALDRGAGSGVIGRFGDAVLDLSRLFLDPWHQGNVNSRHRAALDANGGEDLDCYRLTFAGVRSFRAPRPLDLIWTFPTFTVADPGDRLADCGVVGSDPMAEANARRSGQAANRHDLINEAVSDALSTFDGTGEVPTKAAVFGRMDLSGLGGMTEEKFSKLFERGNGWFGFETRRAEGRQYKVVPKA